MRRRGAMVIRRLCAELGAERVYCKMAAIIVEGGSSSTDGKRTAGGGEKNNTAVAVAAGAATAAANSSGGEEDLEFSAAMVEALNLILLTAPECASMREQLSGAAAAAAARAQARAMAPPAPAAAVHAAAAPASSSRCTPAGATAWWGLYKLNPIQLTHSLKAAW